eukprot:4857282-Alexandrium_andersonii.AAC.1
MHLLAHGAHMPHARAFLLPARTRGSRCRSGSPGRSSLRCSVPFALRRQFQATSFGSVPLALPGKALHSRTRHRRRAARQHVRSALAARQACAVVVR